MIKLRESDNLKNGLLDLINYINSFSDTKDMSLIEIGSYLGESTVIFAEYFKFVYSVDPFVGLYTQDMLGVKSHEEFEEFYIKFKENISNFPNIEHFRVSSNEFKSEHKYDVVYIDGDHSLEQVRKDINNFLPLIKSGGFISGHDYYEEYGDVKPVVDDIFGKPDMIFQDASWIKRVD